MQRSALKTFWLSAIGLSLLFLSSAHGLELSPSEEIRVGAEVKLSTGTFRIKSTQIEQQEAQGWKVVFRLTPVTLALFRRERPGAYEGTPGESIESFAIFRDQIWYGLSFYEGEGSNGIGGIGFFDTRTGKAGTLRSPSLIGHSVTSIEVTASGVKLNLQPHYESEDPPAKTLTLDAPTTDLEASMVGRHEKEKSDREAALHAGGLILDQTCTLTERVRDCGFNAKRLHASFGATTTASNYTCAPGGLFSVHVRVPDSDDYRIDRDNYGGFELVIPGRSGMPYVPSSPMVPVKLGASWTVDNFDARMRVELVDVKVVAATCADPVARFSGPVIDSITFRAKGWGIGSDHR